MINSKDINDIFFEIENEYHLFDKKINNIYFWEIIRFQLNREILIKKWLINSTNLEKLNIYDKIIKSFYIIYKMIFKNIFYSKQDNLFIFWHSRRQKINGFNYDIYTDIIKKELVDNKVNFQDCEWFYWSENNNKSKESKNILYYDFIEILPFFIPTLFRLNNEDKVFINNLEKIINEEFNVIIDLKYIVKKLLFRFNIYFWIINLFLKYKKPKIILQVVWYNIFNLALNKATKKNNIVNIELQHWVIDKYHFWYSMWNKKDQFSNYFPDYIFSWWKYWNNVCIYPKNCRVIDFWFPFFDLNKGNKNTLKDIFNKNILIISQGAIWEDLARKIYELANELKEYKFYYKLHPWEFHKLDNELSFLKNIKNIKIIKSEKTIYELFSICNTQIWVFSTAIYEWLGFWLNTIVYNLAWVEYLDDLIFKWIVKKVNDTKECVELINNNDFDSSWFKSSDFFKEDSLKNISEKIKNLSFNS